MASVSERRSLLSALETEFQSWKGTTNAAITRLNAIKAGDAELSEVARLVTVVVLALNPYHVGLLAALAKAGGPASPAGTHATTITDRSGNVWTLGPAGQTLRNGIQLPGVGSMYCPVVDQAGVERIYVKGAGNNVYWYVWNDPVWTRVSTADPADPPPSPVHFIQHSPAPAAYRRLRDNTAALQQGYSALWCAGR